MDITPITVTINELVEGYSDDSEGEGGVVGFGGLLNIRPSYQREFVYKGKKRDDVIRSVLAGFPINIMYWATCPDERYEVLDGQQRTISICQYVSGEFSFSDPRFDNRRLYFSNLPADIQRGILDYKLTVYLCDGEPSEKLHWFKIVNMIGEKLTDQELLNATYPGPWLEDAKRYFSRNVCAAYKIGKDYLKGNPIRQEYLETAIKWISGDKIEEYMGQHQHDSNAEILWSHFRTVISWIETNFINKREKMKGVNWGYLYDSFKDKKLDPIGIEKETKKLVLDDDVSNQSGIYPYILTRDEKHLNIRAFTKSMKQKTYEKQSGKCILCRKTFKVSEMQGDHITPWSEGGKTIEENCQMLCKECNRRKSNK